MAVRKIRYAVVGLGHIAQDAVLPAFAHARRNSVLTAVVSDNAVKRRAISTKYKLSRGYTYAEYEECLRNVDAVYIALPNSLHAEYTIRAAKAGVHVLCEKPMAVTVRECRRMIAACRSHRVRLMIAYRLHFEEINLDAMRMIRDGKIGEPRYFNSSFSMTVRSGNVRTKGAEGNGPFYDIGIYCVNAARYLFRGEPVEVQALSVGNGKGKFREIDESSAALMRFEGNRLAVFVSSFNASHASSYQVVGSRGQIRVEPAYSYSRGLGYELTVDKKKTRKTIGRRDQFASELLYFSDCILHNREPEPGGSEGEQDVRIIESLLRSAKTGRSVKIPPFADMKPGIGQRILRPAVRKPELIEVASSHT